MNYRSKILVARGAAVVVEPVGPYRPFGCGDAGPLPFRLGQAAYVGR